MVTSRPLARRQSGGCAIVAVAKQRVMWWWCVCGRMRSVRESDPSLAEGCGCTMQTSVPSHPHGEECPKQGAVYGFSGVVLRSALLYSVFLASVGGGVSRSSSSSSPLSSLSTTYTALLAYSTLVTASWPRDPTTRENRRSALSAVTALPEYHTGGGGGVWISCAVIVYMALRV